MGFSHSKKQGTSMKLSKYAQMIKNELALELAKHGSTLSDLEMGLKNLNTGEGVLKVAGELSLVQDFVAKPLAGAVTSLPGWALNASAAGGAAAGLTFDELESSVVDLNRALDREREKVHIVKKLTENIRKEYGIN
jgi:hypothetical protein